jgi:5-methylcytosine-specific restriction endonuclease McrA
MAARDRKLIRIDRRYKNPYRLTPRAQWLIVKWGALAVAWLALASRVSWAGIAGVVALCVYGGVRAGRWNHRRRQESLVHEPPLTSVYFPSVPPLGERNSRVIPQDVKIAVAARDGGMCRYCGSAQELHYDHVIPWSKGGANTVSNIQLLCGPCNRAKGAKDNPLADPI